MLFTASIVINNRIINELFNTLKILNDSEKIIKIVCIFNGKIEPEIISKLNLEKISVYRVENKGFGAAHNFAISKILKLNSNHLILNPDIKLEKNQLNNFLMWFNNIKQIGIGAPRISNFSGKKIISAYEDLSFWNAILRRISYEIFLKTKSGRSAISISNSDNIVDVDLVSGCFMALSKAVLSEKLFDESFFLYYEDYDLCKYVKTIKNLNIKYNPSITVIHDEGRESTKKLKFFFIHVSSHFRYYIKWRKK